MSKRLKDFCLIYYDDNMNGKRPILWSDSPAKLAEVAYEFVLAKKYHAAKIFDRDLKVVYFIKQP